MKRKYKFYTEGNITIRVYDGDTPPENFYPGRTFNSNPWNKGLTMDDEKVRANVEAMHAKGHYNSWNTGLTKETDDRLKAIAQKISNNTKGRKPWNKGVPMSDESKEKISKSNKGNIPYNKGLTKETNDSLKSASEKLKGHKSFVSDWESAKKKEYETRRLNNTFNSSEPEKKLIDSLISEYGIDDIIHPYRDERYPYNCDVYVKSEDLFIEYHGTWEHGGHPFNPNNKEDIQTLEKWKEKSKTSKRYEYAIYYWTELDVKKLDTFRKNKLNFKIIYPSGEIIDK